MKHELFIEGLIFMVIARQEDSSAPVAAILYRVIGIVLMASAIVG